MHSSFDVLDFGMEIHYLVAGFLVNLSVAVALHLEMLRLQACSKLAGLKLQTGLGTLSVGWTSVLNHILIMVRTRRGQHTLVIRVFVCCSEAASKIVHAFLKTA